MKNFKNYKKFLNYFFSSNKIKIKKNNFYNIYYINPEKEKIIYIYDFQNFENFKDDINTNLLKDFSNKRLKDNIYNITYISTKDIITINFSEDEKIINKIENLEEYIKTKIYTDISGIDKKEKYKFKYSIYYNEEKKKYIIHILLISEYYIEKNYSKYVKHLPNNCIDFIANPIVAFDVLYNKKYLTVKDQNKDLHVYISNDYILLVLYINGKFIKSTILLEEGFNKIYKKLENMEIIEDLNYDLFTKILIKKGVASNNYFYFENIIYKTIKKELLNITDLITMEIVENLFTEYDLTDIDNLYYSTVFGDIPGLKNNILKKKLSNFNIEIKTYNLKFDYLKHKDLTFLDLIVLEYSIWKIENKDNKDNYTLWQRPPKFYQKVEGKLLILTGVILLSYIITYIGFAIKNITLNKKLESEEKIYKNLQQELLLKNNKLNMLKKETNNIEDILINEYNYIRLINKKLIIFNNFKNTNFIIELKDLLKNIINNEMKINELYLYDKNIGVGLNTNKLRNLETLISKIDKNKYKIILKDINSVNNEYKIKLLIKLKEENE